MHRRLSCAKRPPRRERAAASATVGRSMGNVLEVASTETAGEPALEGDGDYTPSGSVLEPKEPLSARSGASKPI